MPKNYTHTFPQCPYTAPSWENTNTITSKIVPVSQDTYWKFRTYIFRLIRQLKHNFHL